jgi:hypothetical protein
MIQAVFWNDKKTLISSDVSFSFAEFLIKLLVKNKLLIKKMVLAMDPILLFKNMKMA